MIRFLGHNIILGIVLNIFIAPMAYLFRKKAQRKKGFLGTFLSDDNMYGDKNGRPNLKNKFLRAYLGMLRNPRQNGYGKDFVEGKETNFKGSGKVKYGNDITIFRTVICSDTGDGHGKIIDFEKSYFGTQDITFDRIDDKGNIQKCFKKSRCIPFRFMFFGIMLGKGRRGHSQGLMQYSIAKPLFKYKLNKEGFKAFKKKDGKTITLK